ncbi:hypothetical protein DYB25_011450 [Aphanomyces astaci]|uniref:Uncharacterized protein n=1 Tax=Aphanomyces astaci TaxID=112090 RepID=A0A397FAZ8_APHAT|nr:hypothetical protein DYB25_011450 [Aphanomyces astaci]RHY44855.1 hypothetical protein DYB34_011539 [Aphanomyces astaci]RHY81042.1 hypothetical protein DYB26_010131 [Aphanomyces astaci]RHZ16844.1 hypothetical protein DYB31_010933 [Aphanomyces astaci]
MHYERAGDQLVGRVVAGQPLNNAKFAVLPPHFKDTNSAAVLGAIKARFPALADVTHLRGIPAHGLASLEHLSNYILDIPPTKHTIFHTAPFREPLIMVALKAELVSTTPRLQPSGIPPYIEVYRLLEVQGTSIDMIPTSIVSQVRDILDERDINNNAISPSLLRQTICSDVTGGLTACHHLARTQLLSTWLMTNPS